MSHPSFNRIKGDLRTVEGKLFNRWISEAASLRSDFYDDGRGFDPLLYNETATVSFLTSAASRIDLIALAEYTESHRNLPAGRRKGRCDLYVSTRDWKTEWLIEFKQSWHNEGSIAGVTRKMNEAIECAFARDRIEARDRYACCIFVPWKGWEDNDEADDQPRWRSFTQVEQLAAKVDHAYKIGGAACPAYILAQKIPRMARNVERYILDLPR